MEEPGVVHLLEAALQLLADHVPAADHQHRCVPVEGGGNPGHRVGHSGACGHCRHPEPAGQPGIGFSGVGSCLFVPDVDNPDSLLDTAIEDRHDMSPGQSEYYVYSLGLESPSDDLASVYLCHDLTLFEEGGQTQVDARA